nr:WD40 repeat domain-containing protein [Nocardia amamiensis]
MSTRYTRLWRTAGLPPADLSDAEGAPSTTALAVDHTGTPWYGRVDGTLLTAGASEPATIGAGSAITAVACTPAGLAIGNHAGSVFVVALGTDRRIDTPVEVIRHRGTISGLCWSKDIILSAGWDGRIRACTPAGGHRDLYTTDVPITALTRTDRGLAVALLDGTVLTRDGSRPLGVRARLDDRPTSLATPSDRQLLAATAHHTLARITESGTIDVSATCAPSYPTAVLADPALGVVVTASSDGLLRSWSSSDLSPRGLIPAALSPLAPAALGADHILYYGRRGGGIGSNSLPAAPPAWTVEPGHHGPIWCVRISQEAQVVASAASDATVRLWDLRTGPLLRVLAGHDGWVNSVAFNGDGTVLASGSADSTVRLWNPRTGRLLQVTMSGSMPSQRRRRRNGFRLGRHQRLSLGHRDRAASPASHRPQLCCYFRAYRITNRGLHRPRHQRHRLERPGRPSFDRSSHPARLDGGYRTCCRTCRQRRR